jgi:DNA-binding transcriptional ArsR family regulator
MAELLRGRPALQAEWLLSLGLDLFSTASLTTVVHEFEGLGAWLLEAHSALPAPLRHDLELALRLTNYPQAIVEGLAEPLLDAEHPAHRSADALFDAIAALDADACQQLITTSLAKSLVRHNVETPHSAAGLLNDPAALEATLAQIKVRVALAEAVALLRQPLAWRDLVLNSLRQFWERSYREQWERTRDQLARSVAYHRRQSYPIEFNALFTAVTGRQVPDRARGRLTEIEQVRFVPSLYLGPYVSFLVNGAHVTIYYNGEGTPADEDNSGPHLEDVYHPLTALADKTRLAIVAMLSGRELYAQEIVDRLGISQSAVSRHLQLMVDMKVLNVRRGERGAKFYSINRTALQHVAQRLSELR